MNIKKITTKTALVIVTSAMMSSSVFAACSADIDMGANGAGITAGSSHGNGHVMITYLA
jgi:hypothetical protein